MPGSPSANGGRSGADGVRPPLCVYCRRRPEHERFRPFCSERCRLLDLAAWADGLYRVPGEPISTAEDTGADEG